MEKIKQYAQGQMQVKSDREYENVYFITSNLGTYIHLLELP